MPGPVLEIFANGKNGRSKANPVKILSRYRIAELAN
jgi:hypothetical protein